MIVTPTEGAAAAPPTPAVVYRRAHAGKLMVVEPRVAREPVPSDFFHFDSVGTHPTGLIVTGKFAHGRLASMMASTVRDASEAEIAGFRAGHTPPAVPTAPLMKPAK